MIYIVHVLRNTKNVQDIRQRSWPINHLHICQCCLSKLLRLSVMDMSEQVSKTEKNVHPSILKLFRTHTKENRPYGE